MRTYQPKACVQCGETFTPTGPSAKFCSKSCQYGVAECRYCATPYVRTPGRLREGFCTKRCWYDWRSANVPQTRVHPSGYVIRRVPSGTPGTQGDRSWMLEHRYVMAEVLGRPLIPGETVHHINGDKADNRPENLQLRVGNHGKGSVIGCLDCGSTKVGYLPI